MALPPSTSDDPRHGTAQAPADVCLLVEGAYPHVAGGVSTWIDQLIRAHSGLTFHVVALAPSAGDLTPRYAIPDNVLSLSYVYLAELPARGGRVPDAPELCAAIEKALTRIQCGKGSLRDLNELAAALAPYAHRLDDRFLASRPVWDLLVRMYQTLVPRTSFSGYFWSCKAMLSALLAIMCAPLPPAKVYHTVSTGYAGLLGARARAQTGRPLMVTEHGIYANERRIELLLADWLASDRENAVAEHGENPGNLRDLWISCFASYTRICYSACARIITLYEGNQKFQLRDGAASRKLMIIPNGIDASRFESLRHAHAGRRPTIALIGRVVPIKDVKTFVRACGLLRRDFPQLRALVLGPTDEDPDYYEECAILAQQLACEQTIEFTGKVNIFDFLGTIDVMVLTSISEAQPLVVLEAGVAGIPVVATDVGACREMILGARDEIPPLGPGGAITALASPAATAAAVAQLLGDAALRRQRGAALRQRVLRYYDKRLLDERYRRLYDQLAAMPTRPPATVRGTPWPA